MNDFMQYTYKGNTDAKELVSMWGGLLLAIRRDLIGKKTKLSEIDMLRSTITDIDKVTST